VRLPSVSIAVVCVAVPAALAAGGNRLITESAIGGGSLGQTRAAYAAAYGSPLRTDRLEGNLTRVVYRQRVEVYFRSGSAAGIAVVVAGSAFRTGKGVGPCSPAAAVRAAYPGSARVPLAGPEYAYRLGSRLWFEIEAGKVAAVALGTKAAAFYAANTAPCH
jgi:hypothetical protein